MLDAVALKKLLEDRAFIRPVLEEFTKLPEKGGGIQAAINIATVYLIRNKVPRDRSELLSIAWVMGMVRGLFIGGGKEEIQ